jgi:hypothetical protein
MILKDGHSTKYLEDYKNGLIPVGKGLGCQLDEYLLWKDSQLNLILGHDNVGKTYFIEWYFLANAINNGLTSTLFMDENYHGKVMRDLVQIYTGKNFKDLSYSEIRRAELKVQYYFKFVDNSRRYTPDQMMDVFNQSNTDNYLIDPFNALNTEMTYSANYEMLNKFKMFTKTGKTMYINAHPSSASGRRNAIFPKGHHYAGHVMPPLKSDIEGGKAFPNKADDFIVVHRLPQHPDMWMYTMVEVVKIKDTDTGGKCTRLEVPILLDYNFGLGFKINGIDPIKRPNMIPIQQQIEMQEVVDKENKVKIAAAFANVNLTPKKVLLKRSTKRINQTMSHFKN